MRRKVEMDAAEKILQYFLRNPQAADTLEGIAQWRLSDRCPDSLEQTREALTRLVSLDLVIEEHAANGTTVFRLNPRNLHQAKRLIAHHDD
jgi:hypothetical protein